MIKSVLLWIPEPALLNILGKKIKLITVNENKVCIGNDNLSIVGHKSYHMVGSFESYPRFRSLGSCLRVRRPGSSQRSWVRGPARGSGVWGPAEGLEYEVLPKGPGSGVRGAILPVCLIFIDQYKILLK